METERGAYPLRGSIPSSLFFERSRLKPSLVESLTTNRQDHSAEARIRLPFSRLFSFIDQRNDYAVSSSHARTSLVPLLAGAVAVKVGNW